MDDIIVGIPSINIMHRQQGQNGMCNAFSNMIDLVLLLCSCHFIDLLLYL